MKTYHTDNVSLESFSMYVKLTMTQGPTKHHLLISQFSTGGTLQEKKKSVYFSCLLRLFFGAHGGGRTCCKTQLCKRTKTIISVGQKKISSQMPNPTVARIYSQHVYANHRNILGLLNLYFKLTEPYLI